MKDDWHWRNTKIIKLKKEGKNYVLWRIWWSICTTRTKEKSR